MLQLRAEVEAAEAELTQDNKAFAEEKRVFAAGRKAEVMQSTAACQELLGLQQSTKVTINNKKQDWLKIKVSLLRIGLSLWRFDLLSDLYVFDLVSHKRFYLLICFVFQFLLEARKIKLLSELQTIYPIERLDNGEYAIRGVEMPADL